MDFEIELYNVIKQIIFFSIHNNNKIFISFNLLKVFHHIFYPNTPFHIDIIVILKNVLYQLLTDINGSIKWVDVNELDYQVLIIKDIHYMTTKHKIKLKDALLYKWILVEYFDFKNICKKIDIFKKCSVLETSLAKIEYEFIQSITSKNEFKPFRKLYNDAINKESEAELTFLKNISKYDNSITLKQRQKNTVMFYDIDDTDHNYGITDEKNDTADTNKAFCTRSESDSKPIPIPPPPPPIMNSAPQETSFPPDWSKTVSSQEIDNLSSNNPRPLNYEAPLLKQTNQRNTLLDEIKNFQFKKTLVKNNTALVPDSSSCVNDNDILKKILQTIEYHKCYSDSESES